MQLVGHGQTAALQRFFVAPVTSCNDALPCLWASFCRKNTLKWTVFGLKREQQAKFFLLSFLRPAVLYFFQIWPLSEKVWPPLQ